MTNKNDLFIMTEEQSNAVSKFVDEARQDGPFYYEEGECEVQYIAVKGGEIRVFHHIPKEGKTKRPIVFFPGFGNTPWVWRNFGLPLRQFGEYYVIETREKKPSKMIKHRKNRFSIDQMAHDVGQVIKHLGIDKRDYILMAASFCGGVLLQGLMKKYYQPNTVIAFDPFPKFIHQRFIVKVFFGLTPGFVLDGIKMLLAKLVLVNMKNQAQKERNMDVVSGAVGWKWRKALLHNVNFDIYPFLKDIENEVFLFHGPKDRYHPREIYYNITSMLPKGRFFFMDTDENDRELMAGAIAREFAKVTAKDGVPPIFEQFEIKVDRT